ncbi:hypothetical protein DRQ12_11815 [candidate division KSB1 bacterium]|nr:MAG: hypothetical protein DRQ12_11815 [candidate division KSB1 bacterium]
MMFKMFCAWELPIALRMTDESSLREILRIAQVTDYRGIQVDMRFIAELAQEKSIDYVKELFSSYNITPEGWHVGDFWRLDESQYKQGIEELPLLAQISADLQCQRAYIWMPNWSDERDYAENFKWHVKRLCPIADIFKDYNLCLALEWQGTKTERVGHKYEFIHNMKAAEELVGEISRNNVGLLLDSWHIYAGHDSMEDIKKLNTEVLYVHICDAPEGDIDQMPDLVREAPGTTGQIDLVGFLRNLHEIGYNGPVEPSIPLIPPGSPLKNKNLEESARFNSQALDQLFHQAGIKP